jgi:hypothetical protein
LFLSGHNVTKLVKKYWAIVSTILPTTNVLTLVALKGRGFYIHPSYLLYQGFLNQSKGVNTTRKLSDYPVNYVISPELLAKLDGDALFLKLPALIALLSPKEQFSNSKQNLCGQN